MSVFFVMPTHLSKGDQNPRGRMQVALNKYLHEPPSDVTEIQLLTVGRKEMWNAIVELANAPTLPSAEEALAGNWWPFLEKAVEVLVEIVKMENSGTSGFVDQDQNIRDALAALISYAQALKADQASAKTLAYELFDEHGRSFVLSVLNWSNTLKTLYGHKDKHGFNVPGMWRSLTPARSHNRDAWAELNAAIEFKVGHWDKEPKFSYFNLEFMQAVEKILLNRVEWKIGTGIL